MESCVRYFVVFRRSLVIRAVAILGLGVALALVPVVASAAQINPEDDPNCDLPGWQRPEHCRPDPLPTPPPPGGPGDPMDPDLDSDGDGINNHWDPDDNNDGIVDDLDPNPTTPNPEAPPPTTPEPEADPTPAPNPAPAPSTPGTSQPRMPRAQSAAPSLPSGPRAVTQLPSTGMGVPDASGSYSLDLAATAGAALLLAAAVSLRTGARMWKI